MIQAVSDIRHFTTAPATTATTTTTTVMHNHQILPVPTSSSTQQLDTFLVNISINQTLNKPSIIKRADYIRRLFPNKRIVFCRDTHVANVISNLAAFTNVLANHHADIVLIQVCTTSVPASELAAVPELVRQINQLYGTTECVPVHFYYQDVDYEEQAALMTASDVGVFLGSHSSTAVVAQEFVVCQHHHYAPLILSQDSLLSAEKDIISTTESSVSAVTTALQDALNMSSTDAKRRHEVFYRILSCTLFIR
jgi:trehalose-6-phosphate synthase